MLVLEELSRNHGCEARDEASVASTTRALLLPDWEFKVHVKDVHTSLGPTSGRGRVGQSAGSTIELSGRMFSFPEADGILLDRVRDPNSVLRKVDLVMLDLLLNLSEPLHVTLSPYRTNSPMQVCVVVASVLLSTWFWYTRTDTDFSDGTASNQNDSNGRSLPEPSAATLRVGWPCFGVVKTESTCSVQASLMSL
jgi:hypothetical protein